MKAKAVMYGAGNIGKGFIGEIFYRSGYHTTFIDVNQSTVDLLNRDRKYPIFVTNDTEYLTEWVEDVSAVNGTDREAVVNTIAECDIMATALGANILPIVAPIIASAISKRKLLDGRPLNIFICENLIGSGKYLHDLVKPHIDDPDVEYFENMIGFVSVCVGRTVPKTPESIAAEYPLAACTEPYCELPVDADGFRPVGCEMPPLVGLVPFSPFEFFIERKLLIHNMGHALTAYLAHLKGHSSITEAMYDAEIKYILTRALIESARALSKRHNAPLDDSLEFVEELMIRFENKMLEDTPLRVGRDSKRKLSASDRLVGAFNCVKEQGGVPAHIAVGIAAGYLFDDPADPISVEVSSYAKAYGLRAALEKYSAITADEDVNLIETFYCMLVEKAPFSSFVDTLAKLKNSH